MYRLKKEFRGKFIAIANPPVLLSDQFVADGAKADFISKNAGKLAKYIETKEGKEIAEVEEVQEEPKVDEVETPKTEEKPKPAKKKASKK